MLNSVLELKNVKKSTKITIKMLVSISLIALSILLPQLVHLFLGVKGGVMLLPMYLPILLGGCLLGVWWGLGVGILAPTLSFCITSLFGNAMPSLQRLPFIMIELCIYALLTGCFSKKIFQNKWMVIPVIWISLIIGRGCFFLSNFIIQNNAEIVWNQIQSGFVGLALHAFFAPCIILILVSCMKKEYESK